MTPMKPSYPSGLSKTIEDLVKEPSSYSGQEFEWARAYEKEQLKKLGVRYPMAGDIFEAMHDIEVTCMTHWRAPVSGGEKVIVPAGTRIKVEVQPSSSEPIGVFALPLDYERLEKLFVSQSDISNEKYAGYSLSVKTAQLNKDFKLVSS